MNRKSIATNMPAVSCDVCGRTLLRGENADVFLYGGARRTVCELCTSRAMHEGWIREGVDGAMPGRTGERGSGARSLLTRLRLRREGREEPSAHEGDPSAAVPVDDGFYYEDDVPAQVEPVMPGPEPPAAFAMPEPPAQEPVAPVRESRRTEPPPARTARNVHAVPTNAELKVARALELFNVSSHPRTVAGVTRSLGAPLVSARPSATEGAIVTIVVGWELSWYRYEVDLGDEGKGVRVAGQGTELSELDPAEQAANATADERGALRLATSLA